jgi:hypothetical protein
LLSAHPQVGLRLAGARAVLVSRTEWAQFVLIDGADAFTKKGTAFFPVRMRFFASFAFALCMLC